MIDTINYRQYLTEKEIGLVDKYIARFKEDTWIDYDPTDIEDCHLWQQTDHWIICYETPLILILENMIERVDPGEEEPELVAAEILSHIADEEMFI